VAFIFYNVTLKLDIAVIVISTVMLTLQPGFYHVFYLWFTSDFHFN